MSYRGRGRGRGRGGGFSFRPAKAVSFELFPEIEDLGKAKYSTEHLQLIQFGHELQKFWKNSPYFVQDKDSSQLDKEINGCMEQQSYIERYSDRKSQATKVNLRLSDYMELGPGYVPAELATGGKKRKRAVKRVKWNSDLQEQDLFEKLLRKQEHLGDDKKEDENEEEEEESNEEEDGDEYSDEGDYEQGEYFDDDEDDYNMPESDDEGPIY